MRSVLTIAGSDSSAGAGIQADLKTFAAHHVYGSTAITAITAQNTRGVDAVLAIPTDLVAAQIRAVASDLGVHAAKTGMLPTAEIVAVVAATTAEIGLQWLVVDPVMVAKSGARLIDDAAVEAMRAQLLPHAFVVTPNIPEAEVLTGMRILGDADRREAAARIRALGPKAVIIKGGHIERPDIHDLLVDGDGQDEFVGERVPGAHTHGTGCTFSAALVAHLAHGRSLRDAIPMAQRYVAGAIRFAPGLGSGHGPMDHFWPHERDRAGRL